MIRRILALLLRQSRALYLVLLMVLLVGVLSYQSLPSDVYPELAFPRIAVISTAGDMAPDRVLLTVTRQLEQAASHVYGVRWIRSKTIRGASELSIEFQPGTNMVFAWQQLEARLAEMRQSLPSSASLLVEPVTPAIFPVLNYNVSSDRVSPADLYNIVRYQIEPRLTQVRGVARVITQSGKVPEIAVQVDLDKLKSYKISISEIVAALSRTNQVQVLGRVDDRYQQNLIIGPGEAKVPEDLYGVVVSRAGSGPVFLKDIATIVSGYQDPLQVISVDGKEGIVLNIFRQPNSNVVAVADGVTASLVDIEKTLPAGIHIRRAYDQSLLVRQALASILDEIIIGILLIVVILFLFLRSWKSTLIAALTIPLCAAAAFAFMALCGQSLNLMSLGGLAIAIGLVIDDAIVIVENMHRQLSNGLTPAESAMTAVPELVGPVTSSTATTLVVFLPLGLLSGVAGQFFGALTITLASAVFFSLVLALFVIPVISAQWLRKEPHVGAKMAESETASAGKQSARRDLYSATLDRLLRHPFLVLAGAAVVILGTTVLLSRLGTDFLPEVDEGSYVVDYFMPPGTSLSQTNAICRRIEAILHETPEVVAWTRRTGAELGLFATEPNTGDVLVVLKPHGQRKRTTNEVMDEQRGKIAAQIPEVEIEFHPILADQLNDLSGTRSPVEVRIFGEDAATIRSVAEQVDQKMQTISGLVDIAIRNQGGAPQIDVVVDPWRAGRLLLTPLDVTDQLKGAFLGQVATQIRQGDKFLDVRVRLPDNVRNDASTISSLPIFGHNGTMLPLNAIATVRQTAGEREIDRENQLRYISVEAAVQGRDLGSATKDLQKVLSTIALPAGVALDVGGIYATQQETFHQLLLVLVLATSLVYLMMVMQFRSLLAPLAILVSLPLGLFGVALALLLTRTPLNVSSFMGVILLVGLVVKNGIILLEYSSRLQATGMPIDEALEQAGRVRLRPILMTTLCTVLALLPLAIGWGAGAELHRPLAIAVIGGLTLSTPFTLFVVPVLYKAFAKRT